MYEKELKRVLDASQNNALSFFVGAGVSALSNAPTWKGLINAICDKMGLEKKEDYSSDELLQIPQMFYYSMEDKSEYNKFVREQLHSADLVSNDIHHEMLNLNPVSFITTNYDTLIEDSALQHCKSYKAVACDGNVPKIYGDRFILKVHGDFSNNNFVLKEEDYLNYSENFKLIETLTKSIFSTNTVVFIGYGLNDYNIKLIVNWAKSLLKDDFLEPIFIYTGDQALTEEELIYHKSKGLSVIEWYKLVSHSDEHLPRYKAFFDALKSMLSLDGKTEDEAFEMLYNLLQPLNSLNALRINDVSARLARYVRISEDGVIRMPQEENLLLTAFLKIHQMTKSQRDSLDKRIIEKYDCILSVFKKARICQVEKDHKIIRLFIENIPFADKNCILFDFFAMNSYVSKEYVSIEKNYKKAFYLSQLKRYDEAFSLFSKVAKQAFADNNYLLYYFAESNCIYLRTIITNINHRFGNYDLSIIESLSPNDTEIENLFRGLPVEFRNKYDSFKDVHSANMLYKYSYESFIDGQNLKNAIESEAIEFGLTSSSKAFCRINDYLHFLQSNGIIAEPFKEYRSTVQNLMSLLVYKYSTQGKKTLREQPFSFTNRNSVCFDELDFYCFISCFTDKDIQKLFNKYHVKTIEFANMGRIETIVKNILNYYEYLIKTEKKISVAMVSLQGIMKNCLSLLRYVNISQDLVNQICVFILSHEFGNVYISDKVLFLDSQLGQKKMYSEVTAKTIEKTLVSYIDKHIFAIETGDRFELPSPNGINYCHLVNYIHPIEKEYVSRRLSLRVSYIIKQKLAPLYSHVIECYSGFVSNNQKKRLVTWANKQLIERFSFEQLSLLVRLEARITSKVINQLKNHLKNTIELEKSNDKNGVVVFPAKNAFEELEQVGYWCLINVLHTKDFQEFLGISPKFDFYCKYTDFDFNRFEVSWLLDYDERALTVIAKDKKIKEKIRLSIASILDSNTLQESDANDLQSILAKHFC